MRIAVISDLWPPFPGGAERLIFNISRELKNRGHEIYVLTSYIKAHEFDGIVPIWKSIGCHVYDCHPGHTHADGWQDIQEFIGVCDPDIILTHQFFANEFADELFDGPVPVVHLVHNGLRNPKAALAIYNSSYTCLRAKAALGDLVILPPAFNDCVAPRHDDFIGFIKPIPHKGVDFFYQLATQLPEKKFLVLRGEWQNFEDIRRGLPNVFFMEPVDEIKVFYERCRMIVMPSLQEDAGTVAQEAALNGLPCISSNVMGLPETNGGGIILPHVVPTWVATIRDLDNPTYYVEIADRQKKYIASLNWPAKFDELSERICRLAIQ